MRERIVFLDFDGVLNNVGWFSLAWDENLPEGCDKDFDQENVEAVKKLVTAFDADIVVSSSWRHLPEVPDRLVAVGLPRPVGLTPDDPERNRGREISAWLAKHPEVEDYLVLDDDVADILPEHSGHVIQTSITTGFTSDLLKEALATPRLAERRKAPCHS